MILFEFMLNIPVNSFSVMVGDFPLLKCPSQGHNTLPIWWDLNPQALDHVSGTGRYPIILHLLQSCFGTFKNFWIQGIFMFFCCLLIFFFQIQLFLNILSEHLHGETVWSHLPVFLWLHKLVSSFLASLIPPAKGNKIEVWFQSGVGEYWFIQ